MHPQTLLDQFFDNGVIEELHQLLWVQSEERDGAVDGGWHCQEHTVVLGALLAGHGAQVRVHQGDCLFVQRPSEEPVRLALGTTPDMARVGTYGHTWLDVARFGLVDISPNFEVDDTPDLWMPLRSRGVIGGQWEVAEFSTRVVRCAGVDEFDFALSDAAIQPRTAEAIYLDEISHDLDAWMFTSDFISSRATRLAMTLGGKDVFLKLVAHLVAINDGHQRPLAGSGVEDAWREIGSRPPEDAAATLSSVA